MKRLIFATMISFWALPAEAQTNCSTVAECAQEAVEAALQAKLALQTAVPKGAVMAFNLENCPKGWVPFASANGRVIVGSGQGRGLTPRELGQTGGAEEHALRPNEMPRHRHGRHIGQHAIGGSQVTAWNLAGNGGKHKASPTEIAGGGAAQNNMQPFIALRYCERD